MGGWVWIFANFFSSEPNTLERSLAHSTDDWDLHVNPTVERQHHLLLSRLREVAFAFCVASRLVSTISMRS